MKGFWVYILECADKSYYTGHTDNLERRLFEHQRDLLRCYTSNRRPVQLAYACEFESRENALARERRIKGWSRNKKEALMQEDWAALVQHSRARAVRGEPVEP